MKKRSRGRAKKAKEGRRRKRNRDLKRFRSSLATAKVQEHGDTHPLGNGLESLEDRVDLLSEMISQNVIRMQARARGIVQSVLMLVTRAELEFASFLPPTYFVSDIDNDFQLTFVQEQGDRQPIGDGAEPRDLSTGLEDGGRSAAQTSLNNRVNRLWDFTQRLEVHLQAFIKWSSQWLLVIATHLNLDLTNIAPSAADFLLGLEDDF
ncbi:uncharacterized protein LOC129286662 isoform X2 [Prosopis cineraria]|uniref:uncharacterized protein LOC129286662 isoform X2 n=1 Tax=Prosopis cineraria TaxID=364024 RepID=UPI002410AD3F|nr:uncharacterized protein LOC129286662 isoform X2 [Prosopis cineraria]